MATQSGFEVKNSKGQTIVDANDKPILLTQQEIKNAKRCESVVNALGYEVDVTSMTAFSKRVVEQKFFTIAPVDYVPLLVGEGAWSTEILTYRDYSVGGDFESGVLNTSSGNSRMAEADAGVDSVKVPVLNWGKKIRWNLMELQMASRSGNWGLVEAKEKSRKRNWDLGIQRVAFLGAKGNASVKGLLTQSDVASNTSLITKLISSMSAAEFDVLVQGLVSAYRVNCAYTAMPTHFHIPETDYNGLVAPVSATYPNISKIDYLQKAFAAVTLNPNFKILPLAYAAKANNADVSGLNKNRYTLMNYDTDSIRMDLPVDYTSTMAGTADNFEFTNVGYGQFTGVKAYRPKETLYFDWA